MASGAMCVGSIPVWFTFMVKYSVKVLMTPKTVYFKKRKKIWHETEKKK